MMDNRSLVVVRRSPSGWPSPRISSCRRKLLPRLIVPRKQTGTNPGHEGVTSISTARKCKQKKHLRVGAL